ncbi:C40 family peptidase [Paracoccus litorisediminis]|nr:Mov34/MPN/PAD-1 family protein [Paracoccus litorisediminis]
MTYADWLLPFTDALEAAAEHARATFPAESCGFIIENSYMPCANVARPAEEHEDKPDCGCVLCSFEISNDIWLPFENKIQMVVHSHPNGPAYPSQADMQGQEASGLPWAIIPLDDSRIGQPVIWGGDTPMAPVIGRVFTHGVHDCYSLIRDAFALGRDGMAAHGVEGWPYAPVELPIYPRNDEWWKGDDNFYEEKPAQLGFREVSRDDVRPGDVFLCSINSPRLNHGGMLVGNNLILHHLPRRLSRREAAGIWAHSAEKWIRLEGAPLA